MILTRVDPRLSRAVRLVAAALVCWSVIAGAPAPSTHGRGLVVMILLIATVLAALPWLLERDLDTPLRADSYVLALISGALLGAAPSSAAAVFVFVAVVAAGLRVELARAMPVVALGALGLAVSVLVYDGGALGLLDYALGFVAAALTASNIRQFRARAEEAELLLAQTQRSQEERLRATRLEESARIAREIHDVLAHALAGLAIQLEATTALVEGDADRDTVLARVRRAHELSREGLRETRRAVGALRGDPVRAPDSLRELADAYRSADDAPARLEIEGDCGRLAGETGQAVVRVAQEALTNVRKHAPGAQVSLAVHAGARPEENVVLAVQDLDGDTPAGPGSGAPAGSLADTGGGYGLQGMRERAQALGGTLSAGPTTDGWRVELRLPAPGAPPIEAAR
jgi:signal transduction histidine kinase